jgi:hypothetical protein
MAPRREAHSLQDKRPTRAGTYALDESGGGCGQKFPLSCVDHCVDRCRTALRTVWKRAALPAFKPSAASAHREICAHPARRESGAATRRTASPGGRPRLSFKVPRRRSTSPEAAGRFVHIVRCARISRSVSLAPEPQPHVVRGPSGRPRLNFEFLLRGFTCSEPAGRFGHRVKCARIWLAVSLDPAHRRHRLRPKPTPRAAGGRYI